MGLEKGEEGGKTQNAVLAGLLGLQGLDPL